MIGEFDLIDEYFSSRCTDRQDVVLGIGDDAALVQMTSGDQLVIAMDTLSVGTHFPENMPARALGYRSLAVNLSDLAAMGAEPLWCTLALSLPTTDRAWLDDFSAGFFQLARQYGVALVGGDTVRAPLAVTVTVHGRIEPGSAILRSGARVGDGIYVTGYPGDAVAGRKILGESGQSGGSDLPGLVDRFLYPQPRVSEGRALTGIASSMIDLSDGLHADLVKLMSASGAGATLDASQLPVSKSLVSWAGSGEAVSLALTGGDDYELCFTVPPDRQQEFAELSGDWQCGVARIGTVTDGGKVDWQLDGQHLSILESGYDHFQQEDGCDQTVQV